MTTILGIDPGLTTGAAIIEWDGQLPLTHRTVEILSLEQVDFDDIGCWIQATLPTVDHVAAERYQITARTARLSRQYEALYTLGGVVCALQVMATRDGEAPEFHLSPASTAKAAWTNDNLRAAGLYEPTTGARHARDALRHALLRCYSLDDRTPMSYT